MEKVEGASYYQSLEERAAKLLSSENRFVPMEEREDTGVLPAEVMVPIWNGKLQTFWRGVPILKDPFSLTINQQLLWELKPRTVIEFGAYKGGSALWVADMLKIFGCVPRVISVDIDLSMLHSEARKSSDGVEFIQGDLLQVEELFPHDKLKGLDHPWLLFEDAHVNMTGVLEYFDSFLQPGDYICVEDTNPFGPIASGQGRPNDLGYEFAGSAKMNNLRKVLGTLPNRYLVDKRYSDMFGYNGGWNMNGYLKRV